VRYSIQESTYILAVFNPGDTVTIDIYDLDTDTKVVDGASCSEVAGTGVFKYNFTQAVTGKKEYLWIMTNGTIRKYGKIVLGGWLDEVKDRVKTNLDEKVSTRASQTSVDNLSSQLSTHDSDIKAELGDIEGTGFDPAVHSLVKIKGKVDEVDSDLATHDSDIKTELGNIEGTGYDPATHSLVKIKSKVDEVDSDLATHDADIKAELGDIEGSGYDPTVHSLVNIKSKVDEVDGDLATHDSDIKAELGNIEGTGFTPDTHSLVNIKSDTEGIKAQTDKLQFDPNNYVKSMAQNPELANLDTTVSSRASSSELATHDSDIKGILDDIEGTGFTRDTHSLVNIKSDTEGIKSKVDENLDEKVSTRASEEALKRHDAKQTALKFV